MDTVPKTIISVQNLYKKYGDFEAVKNISFDVLEGEIFGLLGPNGAVNSPHHRKNIEGDYTYMGIGVAKNNKGISFFTQIFMRK